MVKATSEGLGIARVLSEWEDRDVGVMIWADASAALGMIERGGTGKVRHIDVGILWLQQKWLKKQVTYGKVPGAENCSDLLTKGLGREKSEEFIKDLGG